MNYGYIRVSTRGQNEDRQVIALAEWGVQPNQIYLDKQSGKDYDRPKYRRLIRKLKSGDTLVVKSIDRLSRNYDEILEQWRIITKEKHADVVVLDMPLLDTRTNRNLTGTLIADIVLQLLSYVAQTEGEFIRKRQAEGIAEAKTRGVRFGRRPIPMPESFEHVRMMYREGNLTSQEAASQLNIRKATFLRRVQTYFPMPQNVDSVSRGTFLTQNSSSKCRLSETNVL